MKVLNQGIKSLWDNNVCGSIMFKVACMYIWKYLLEHNLVFIVKLIIACHDEIDAECPVELKDEITTLITSSMLKAGAMLS